MLSCLLGPSSSIEKKAQAATGILDRKDRLSSAKPQTVWISTRLEMGLADIIWRESLRDWSVIPETGTRYCRIGQGLAGELCHCHFYFVSPTRKFFSRAIPPSAHGTNRFPIVARQE